MDMTIERPGWVLVHSGWQFTLAAALAALMMSAMRRHSAAARYGVLVATMAAMVVASAATWFALPLSERKANSGATASVSASRAARELFESRSKREQRFDGTGGAKLDEGATDDEYVGATAARRMLGRRIAQERDNASQVRGRGGNTGSDLAGAGASADLAFDDADEQETTWSSVLAGRLRPWLNWIVALWVGGVAIASLRPLAGWHWLSRLRRVGLSPVAAETERTLRRVADRMGVKRPVEVWNSTLAQAPLLVGCLKPVILVPASLATNLSVAQLEAIFAHELAHVRRHDFVVNLLQTWVETLFFFHPAAWWLSRQIRIERENCCDDIAVAAVASRVEYGRALIAVEELRSRSGALALGVNDGSLLSRIRRLATPHHHPSMSERWQAATLGFALPGMVLAMTLTWTLAAWDDTSKPTTTTATQPDAQREPAKPSASDSATRPSSQHLELAWQIGFSPIRLQRFPLEGETLASVRHLDSLPQVAHLPEVVQVESARRFNAVLRSLDLATPEKLAASVDRAIAETRDLRQPYRAALMFNVTMIAHEQLNHAHVVKVGFDGRAFEQMKFKAARAGLTDVDSVPIGLVLRLLELASWSQLALDTEGVANWPAERRQMGELWLSQMARLGRIVDPSWDEKDLPRMNVEAPAGLPSGAAPDAVRDAKARAEYVVRIEANRRKAERYNEQLLARRLLAELSPQMDERLVRLYVRRPFDTRELDELMQASSVATERKLRIARTVKLVNSLLPAGTPLKYGWPDALAETGVDGVAQLAAAVSDASYPNFIRHDGAWALGLIGDPRGLAALQAVASDKATPEKYVAIAKEFIRSIESKSQPTTAPKTDAGPQAVAEKQAATERRSSESPTKMWEANLGGPIHGAAVIDGERVYASSGSGELVCADLKDGKRLWSYRAGDGSQPESKDQMRATPTVTPEFIFVGDRAGSLHCVNRVDGTPKWRFGAEDEVHGAAVVAGERVLFGSYDGGVYSVNIKDGTLAWKFATGSHVHAALRVVDDEVLVAGCDGQLRVLALNDGMQKRSFGLGSYLTTTPAIVGDMAYVANFGGELFAVNWKTGEQAWKHSAGTEPILSSPLATERFVVFGCHDKKVRALDRLTGKTVWQVATQDRVVASPVLSGSQVLIGGHDGRLYALELATGAVGWKVSLGDAVSATAAVRDGLILIGSESDSGKLLAFETPMFASGKPVERTEAK